MFNSVRLIDGNEADRLRQKKVFDHERNEDSDLINEISKVLDTLGGTIQKDIVSHISAASVFPRRKIVECLQRWSCSPDEGGLWTLSKGPNNSNEYRLNSQ